MDAERQVEANLAPGKMVSHAVYGQSDLLEVVFLKLKVDLGSTGQFCGTHWSKVLGVGEQNSPSGGEKLSVGLKAE
jgi:hypothetical protein